MVFLPNILASSFVIGEVYALGASLSWAVAVTIFKRWNTALDAQTVTFIQSGFGGRGCCPSSSSKAVPRPHPPVLDLPRVKCDPGERIGVQRILEGPSRMPAAEFTSYFFLVPVMATIMSSVFSLQRPGLERDSWHPPRRGRDNHREQVRGAASWARGGREEGPLSGRVGEAYLDTRRRDSRAAAASLPAYRRRPSGRYCRLSRPFLPTRSRSSDVMLRISAGSPASTTSSW